MQAIIILLLIMLFVVGAAFALAMRKIKYYKMAIGNMSAMVIMQRMFEIMASSIPASNKIEELNNIIIETFNSKYSSIVLYDGTEYEVKASNVEKMYLDSIKELAETQEFKNNALQNISKYLVATGQRVLGYKTAIERQIKSAMFSPIYYNGVFRGFWILEDNAESAYDMISKEELARLKENVGVFIENITSQEAIENAHNTDKQTGFYNNLYLYSNLRQRLFSYNNSALILIQLTNLPYINNNYGREVGNRLLERAAEQLKDMISSDNILVRYSGSKFCIACPGTSVEMLHVTMERYLSNIKMQAESIDNTTVALEMNIVMHDVKKQSNVEKEISRMVEYVENSKSSNTINIM